LKTWMRLDCTQFWRQRSLQHDSGSVQPDFYQRNRDTHNFRRFVSTQLLHFPQKEHLLIGVGKQRDGLLEHLPDFFALDHVRWKFPPIGQESWGQDPPFPYRFIQRYDPGSCLLPQSVSRLV